MIRFRRKPIPLWKQGENLAVKTLKRSGYTILDRNVHLGRYEIDVIARDGDTVAFIEVKTRRSEDVANPEDNVNAKKRRHIVRAARMYMSREEDESVYYRFDVVSVVLPQKGKPEVTVYRDAFRSQGH